jgi:Ca-activated chloride channel family protein
VEKKMNQISAKSTFRLILMLVLLLPHLLATAETSEAGQSSLSPYFFIEGDDSGVERLPLKKTHARVKLNGYMAHVVVTQIYRNQGMHRSTPPISSPDRHGLRSTV